MEKFEENIKKILNQGELPLNKEAFSAFEKRLELVQLKDLVFSKKIKGIFENGMIPFAPAHWNQFEQKFSNTFEQKLRDKVNAGEVPYESSSWDKLEGKLSKGALNNFEQKAANVLNEGEIAYNHQHWIQLAQRLEKTRRPIIWPFWAAAAITAVLVPYFIFTPSYQKDSSTDKSVKTQVITADVKQQLQDTALFHEGPNAEGQETVSDPVANTSVNVVEPKTERRRKISEIIQETAPSEKEVNLNQDVSNNLGQEKKKNIYLNMEVNAQQSKVELSRPDLFKQSENEFPNISPASTVLLEFTPVVNSWDNPSFIGIQGRQHAGINFNTNWKTTTEVEVQKNTELVQPSEAYLVYETRIHQSGLAIGSFYHHLWDNSWDYKTFNVGLSYQQKLFKNVNARFGAAVNYQHNKLHTNDLYASESYYQDGQAYVTEMEANELDIPAEEYMRVNTGIQVGNPYFTFAYQLDNLAIARFNYKNPFYYSHQMISAVHLPIRKVRISAVMKMDNDMFWEYSPALGVSYDNKIYTYAEYTAMSRMNLTLGYQLKNSFRAFVTYGFDTFHEEQARLFNTYTVSGQVGLGVHYIVR